jgi:hypothetical protein
MRPRLASSLVVSCLVVTLGVLPSHARAEDAQGATERRNVTYASAIALLVCWWSPTAVASYYGGYTDVDGTLAIPRFAPGPEWDAFRASGFVPVLGPWIQLATLPPVDERATWDGFLVASALGQGLGLTLMIVAALIHVPEPSSVSVVPSVAADGVGLAAVGVF